MATLQKDSQSLSGCSPLKRHKHAFLRELCLLPLLLIGVLSPFLLIFRRVLLQQQELFARFALGMDAGALVIIRKLMKRCCDDALHIVFIGGGRVFNGLGMAVYKRKNPIQNMEFKIMA